MLDDENAADFAAFDAAVRAELAPAGALQSDLVSRIVMAAWRARRADRLEAALLGRHLAAIDGAQANQVQAALGAGLIRDGNGPRALETRWPEPAPTSGGRCAPTNRYRGSVLAELFRSLAALKALQASARDLPGAGLADVSRAG